MKKYNIILNTTTFCNFDCSYCDVVKNNIHLTKDQLDIIINFILKNFNNINIFKFFGGEPLLAFDNIKYIIDNTVSVLGNKFEIVTNTILLNDEIGEYFNKYFDIIFFSIDSENKFDYDRVFKFIDKHSLSNKVFFNLVVSPGMESKALEQYNKICKSGYKNFNILPVYFTKIWQDNDLLNISNMIKTILDESIYDSEINLYGFQDNRGYQPLLTYDSLFIDIDLNIYYSDFVSTNIGKKVKDKLLLGNLNKFLLNFNNDRLNENFRFLEEYEKYIINNIKGQKKLHKIMDYFSNYLNIKKGIIRD